MHLKLSIFIKYSETGGSKCNNNVSRTEMTCQIGLLIIIIWVTTGQETQWHTGRVEVLTNTGKWVRIKPRHPQQAPSLTTCRR